MKYLSAYYCLYFFDSYNFFRFSQLLWATNTPVSWYFYFSGFSLNILAEGVSNFSYSSIVIRRRFSVAELFSSQYYPSIPQLSSETSFHIEFLLILSRLLADLCALLSANGNGFSISPDEWVFYVSISLDSFSLGVCSKIIYSFSFWWKLLLPLEFSWNVIYSDILLGSTILLRNLFSIFSITQPSTLARNLRNVETFQFDCSKIMFQFCMEEKRVGWSSVTAQFKGHSNISSSTTCLFITDSYRLYNHWDR